MLKEWWFLKIRKSIINVLNIVRNLLKFGGGIYNRVFCCVVFNMKIKVLFKKFI